MPPVGGRELTGVVSLAIEESGWTSTLRSRVDRNPRQFLIWSRDESVRSLWIYIWTLTWGYRYQDEYRIQVTSRLELNPSGETVLLGYEPDLRLFAGFDVHRHRQFPGGSNMIGVHLPSLRPAATLGLAFYERSSGEVVVGFRPDQLMVYVENAGQLHQWATEPDVYEDITEAVASKVDAATPQEALTERQKVVQRVSRPVRARNFRRDVLKAYANKCAVTGLQLKVVQAAHILPVSAPGSVDEVRNGIALAPTYHAAYDDGLIYLNRHFEMVLNEARAREIEELGLQGGLEAFVAPLGDITRPVDAGSWPDLDLVERANQFRNIAV